MEYATGVDVGRRKELNEDSVSAVTFDETHLDRERQRGGIFVLADGMGGEKGGEVASYLATTVIQDELTDTLLSLTRGHNRIMEDMDLDETRLPAIPTPDQIRQEMRDAIEAANEAIVTHRSADEGGTTVVVGLYAHGQLFLGWVGDSVAYVINETDGTIAEMTREHSQVQRYVDNGDIRPEVARVHNENHIVTRALGGRSRDPEIVQAPIYGDDIVLFASDGLLDAYTDATDLYRDYVRATDDAERDEIIDDILDTVVTKDEIRDHVLSADGLSTAAEDLIALANDRGGADNISVVLFSDPEQVGRQDVDIPNPARTYEALVGETDDADILDAETQFID